MKKNTNNFFTFFIGFLIIFLFWKLSFIFAYIFISLIFSIILYPINQKLITYGVNKTISSLVCLCMIFLVIFSMGFIIYPLVEHEINIINNNLDINNFNNYVGTFVNSTNDFLNSYGINSNIKSENIIALFPVSSYTTLFSSIFSTLGNLFLASFSILFMTFFMIRDSFIIKEKVHNFLSIYLNNVDKKMQSITYYLRRYFTGIIIQLFVLFICYGIGLEFLNIQYAWTIAFFAALINIIPYIGPMIGFSFASIIIITNVGVNPEGIELLPNILLKTFILFGSIQTADNFIFQPLIFAQSLKVHPLEIFIIVLSAGMLGGMLWMLLAIPSYALIKICLSGLFTHSDKNK